LQEKEFLLWWRKKDDCFEVCSNAARFKRHLSELRRLNPLKADVTKAAALKESRKKAKLVGEHVDAQTQQAVIERPKKKKETKVPPITNINLLETEAIFAQLSKMSPSERNAIIDILCVFQRNVNYRQGKLPHQHSQKLSQQI
jgi:hypothetical protein